MMLGTRRGPLTAGWPAALFGQARKRAMYRRNPVTGSRMLDEDTGIHPLFAGASGTTGFRKLRKRVVRHTRYVPDR